MSAQFINSYNLNTNRSARSKRSKEGKLNLFEEKSTKVFQIQNQFCENIEKKNNLKKISKIRFNWRKKSIFVHVISNPIDGKSKLIFERVKSLPQISGKMFSNRWMLLLLAILSLNYIVAAFPKPTQHPEIVAVTVADTSKSSSPPPQHMDDQDDDYDHEVQSDEYVEKMSDIFDLPLGADLRLRRRKDLAYCKNIVCMPHYLCINDQIITNGSELLESRLSLRINGDADGDDDDDNQTPNIVCNDMEMPCCADDAMANLNQPDSQRNTAADDEIDDDQKNSNNVIDDDGASRNKNFHSPLLRCGYRPLAESNGHSQMAARILDSDESQPNEFPWMIGLFLRLDNDNLRFIGGGSLIHPSVILTVAHLIQSHPVENLIVRAGEHNILDPLNDGKRQERNVSQKIVHGDLYVKAFINDIALLVIDRPFQLTSAVNTICIPPQSVRNDDDGMMCATSGWGKNAAGRRGQYQATLKKVQLPIVSRRRCEQKLRQTPLGQFYNLDESLMCAGGGRRDTCKGDGGSPLICTIPQDPRRSYQSGIVAAGLGCGSDAPGLYVNVAHFSNWIKYQIAHIHLDIDAENVLSYDLFD